MGHLQRICGKTLLLNRIWNEMVGEMMEVEKGIMDEVQK
jgi:hypothetical protein